MSSQLEFSDIKSFFRRRRFSFFIVFFGIFLFSVFIAYTLPPIYQSQATILIEDQQIPTDIVRPTITGYVEERIKVVSQNVMLRDKLLEIIRKYNLFGEDGKRETKTALVRRFRKSIKIETISASVTNKRTGKAMDATVAFSISFEGRDRNKVKAVTNELAQLFLREDLKSREQRSTVTAEFFQEELENLKSQITEYERQISDFKTLNLGQLPENSRMNFEAIAGLKREKDRIEMQIDSLTERKIYLEGQLASLEPYRSITLDGKNVVLTPQERLRSLRMKLISMQTALSEKHPDIRKLKREIRELEESVGPAVDSSIDNDRLTELRIRLADMEGRLGPKHPDVVKLEREIALLSKEIDRIRSARASSGGGPNRPPDNPAYITMKTQIRSAETQIEALRNDQGNIQASIADYETRLGMTPVVEKRYNEMTRDYENAKQRYNEMMDQYMNARVAQVMEDQQKGERFTLKDPAYLPEKPYKPNRPAIMILGFILAFGGGFGLAAAREFLDRTVKSPDELSSLTGIPVLSVVSLMETAEDRRRKYLKRLLWFLTGLGLCSIGMIVVNEYVMPLEKIVGKVHAQMIRNGLPF